MLLETYITRRVLLLGTVLKCCCQPTVAYSNCVAEESRGATPWENIHTKLKTNFSINDVLHLKKNSYQTIIIEDWLLIKLLQPNDRLQNRFLPQDSVVFSPLTQSHWSMKRYKHVVNSIIRNLYFRDIAFIIDENDYASKFLEKLEKDLTALMQNKKRFKSHKIKYNPTKRKSLFDEFYNLKVESVNLFVVLSSLSSLSDIYNLAFNFDMLMFPNMWFIPHYYDGSISKQHMFNRVVSFKENILDSRRLEYDRSLIMQCQNQSNAPCMMDSMLCKRIANNNNTKEYSSFIVSIRVQNNNRVTITTTNGVIKNGTFTMNESLPFIKPTFDFSANKSLKAVTILDPPFVINNKDLYEVERGCCTSGMKCLYKQKTTCCVGLVVSLFKLVAKELQFNVDLYVVEDNKYGGIEDSGRWNGMIGDLAYGKADIAIAAIAITSLRSMVVDFSKSFLQMESGILTKSVEAPLLFVNTSFLAPLSIDLQVALWTVFIGVIFATYFLNNLLFFLRFPTARYYSLLERFFYVGGIAIQRDLGGKIPRRLGSRTVSIAFAFCMVVVVTTYTVMLAAQRLVHFEKDPLTGMNDGRIQNPTADFTIAVAKGDFFHRYFNESTSPTLKRLNNFMTNHNVRDIHEGVESVKNGTLNAFINEYMSLAWNVRYNEDCELRVVRDDKIRTSYGFAVNKKSKWLENVDSFILHLIENNQIQMIYDQWSPRNCTPRVLIETTSPLNINQFGGLILLLVATIVVSFLILFIEKFLKKTSFYSKLFKRCVSERNVN